MTRCNGARALLLGLGVLSLGLVASARADEHEGALWVVGLWTLPVSETFALHLMTQSRIVDDVRSYERTVVRPYLSVALPSGFEAALGYDAHIFENPISLLESRAWQRLAYEHDWGAWKSQVHFWQEERFIEGSDDVAWRSRINVGASFPISRSLELTGVIRNEFFVNLNETDVIRRTGLGEDHAYAGLRRPFGPWLTLEVGYLMQYRRRPGPDLFDHTLALGFAVALPSLVDLP